MPSNGKMVITIVDDENESVGPSVASHQSPVLATSMSDTVNCQPRALQTKGESFEPKPTMTVASRGNMAQERSSSVSSLPRLQSTTETELRSRSEPYTAIGQVDGSAERIRSNFSFDKNRGEREISEPNPVAPTAFTGPRMMTESTPCNVQPEWKPGMVKACGASQPQTKQTVYQRLGNGPVPSSVFLGPAMIPPYDTVSPAQLSMDRSAPSVFSSNSNEQPAVPTLSTHPSVFPVAVQTAKKFAGKKPAPVKTDKPKRKSNQASSQATKRKKTAISSEAALIDGHTDANGMIWAAPPVEPQHTPFKPNGPSSSNDIAAVDSILWSTPPYNPSKDDSAEGASAPKAKQPRKPRSKPWTCKMLADLGALIQKTVPWEEFAEQNGKSLADVLETYSVVVSMPLLDFADRGQKRITQKIFKDMRQKYKEMEKEALKIGNEQAKGEAEEYFGKKKKRQPKSKEVDVSAARAEGPEKGVSCKKIKVVEAGKGKANGPAVEGAGRPTGDCSKTDTPAKTIG